MLADRPYLPVMIGSNLASLFDYHLCPATAVVKKEVLAG